MAIEFGTAAHDEISGTRRAFLKSGVATAVAAAGMFHAWPVFAQSGDEISPFIYSAPQSALDDLRQRLANTRWPERETAGDTRCQ